MALNSLHCAEVPLRNCSLSHPMRLLNSTTLETSRFRTSMTRLHPCFMPSLRCNGVEPCAVSGWKHRDAGVCLLWGMSVTLH